MEKGTKRRKSYLQIQHELVQKYRVKLNPKSKCWERMHVHPSIRLICKWNYKNSVVATFDLMHEIGHLENNKKWMRRAEEEYYATTWALEKCGEYGIELPYYIWKRFQDYVYSERDQGIRRGEKKFVSLRLPTDNVDM